MNKPSLKLYQAVSALHDAGAVEVAHANLIEALKESFEVEILPLTDIARAGETAVIFMASGGVEETVRDAVLASPAIQRLYLLADGLQNSLAASLETAAWLKTRNIEVRIIHGTPSMIIKELRMLPGADALRVSRVGLIGDASGWLISSEIDFDAVSSTFGIEFIRIPLTEVIEEYATAEPAKVKGLGGLVRVEPSEEDLEKALRLTSAIETIVKRYSLDAFTLKCFDLLEPLGTTGCLALAHMNAKGIPAGCEGDVPSLLTMLLSQNVAGAKAFMANPSGIDVENNEIILAHCTLPLNMAPINILRSHFESGIGVAIQGVLPLGEVTVVKWWGREMKDYFISRGQLIENTDNPSMCRTQVKIRLDENVDYFLTRPLGNHHIVLLGDHTERLRRFFEAATN
ncbi:MAG: fucose isomerase [Muribaculaceae bacterium]|nr:fucose isomerase [Muribaculaceae bacterium]